MALQMGGISLVCLINQNIILIMNKCLHYIKLCRNDKKKYSDIAFCFIPKYDFM